MNYLEIFNSLNPDERQWLINHFFELSHEKELITLTSVRVGKDMLKSQIGELDVIIESTYDNVKYRVEARYKIKKFQGGK